MKVSEILRAKGNNVETIAPSATVLEAVTLLASAGIGALVVSSDQQKVEGILSERDVVRAIPDNSSQVEKLKVSDLMTENVTTCSPDQSIDDLISIMTTGRVRHVPVEQSGQLTGIVSIGDVVKVRLGELERERSFLHDYIAGR